jgi:3-hydroxybutyryl-CoA dehydrogenase
MRVGVIGGGLMGSGIAEVCARSGVDVTLIEVSLPRAQVTHVNIARSLDRAVQDRKLTSEERDATILRIKVSTNLDDIVGADATIEAIVEDEALKREVFARVDALLPDAQFLASNTQSVPIMRLGAATKRPDRVLGMHFFNPAPVMPLIEIVRTQVSADDVIEGARAFAEQTLGKRTIVAPDRAGFIVNALLIPYLLTAIRMYDAGLASREDIDRGMVDGCAHPMGPLALSDLVGLDNVLAVAEALREEGGDDTSVAPGLLRRMVEAGHLGRKTGRGFYEYA